MLTERHSDWQQGFTLIEVMLSVAIMGSMIALVWGSFSLTSRNRNGAEAIRDRYRQVRMTLSRMTREISMAYLSKNDQPGAIHPRTVFVSEREREVDQLTFAAFAHLRLQADAKEGDQSVIRYFAAPDENDSSRLHLFRREQPRLLPEKAGEEGPAFIILEDVKELHYEFFDEVANEWRETWDTTSVDGQPDRLPQKVRIHLTFLDERGKEMELVTGTRIFLRDPLWFSVSE